MTLEMPRGHAPPRLRSLPETWLACAAVLYSCWLLELVVPAGLSMMDSYVSELLAGDQPYRWLFRATDLLAAGCLLLAARRLRGRAVVLPLLVLGVATIADTLLALDCAASVDALCRYREDVGAVSLGHRLHEVTSIVTVGSALVAAVVLYRRTRRRDAAAVVGLMVATGALSVVLQNQPGAGLVQRVQLLTIAAGLLLGARVVRGRRWLPSSSAGVHRTDPTAPRPFIPFVRR
jgi:hypothetical protein